MLICNQCIYTQWNRNDTNQIGSLSASAKSASLTSVSTCTIRARDWKQSGTAQINICYCDVNIIRTQEWKKTSHIPALIDQNRWSSLVPALMQRGSSVARNMIAHATEQLHDMHRIWATDYSFVTFKKSMRHLNECLGLSPTCFIKNCRNLKSI